MARRFFLVGALTVAALLSACTTAGKAEEADAAKSLQRANRIVDAVKPSLARAEFTLRFDKGEAPDGQSARRSPFPDNARLVDEERPLEQPAFVLSPTRVLTPDPLIHPRFIERIAVRQGDQVAQATVAGYALDRRGLVLELSQPLHAAPPLAFDAGLKGPWYAVDYGLSAAEWRMAVRSWSPSLVVTDDARRYFRGGDASLIVDEQGRPVTVLMSPELPADDSWKASPAEWPMLTADQMGARLEELRGRTDASLVRVALSFRSPQTGPETGAPRMYRGTEDDDSATERNVLGVVVDAQTVLVLASLNPRTTARLERIRVYPAHGDSVGARFGGTLSDYGALLATLDKPSPQPATLRPGPLTELRGDLVLAAELQLKGEQRIAYYRHLRLTAFELGKWRRAYPDLGAPESDIFLFDRDGRLAALPLRFRPKALAEERSWRQDQPGLIAASQIAPVLADLAQNTDKSNVPLTEEEENRIAWLGVELQPLNPGLARANNVSDQTSDGQTGVLVTYVYPDSPAAKAGLEMGDILLRIDAAGLPKPIEIRLQEEIALMAQFPWHLLGNVAEQDFDRIPRPWPRPDNALNRALTDLGFSKAFTLDLFRAGKVLTRQFTVEQSPQHFDSAAKYKSEPLGLTVRELTYEVRRYFQLPADAPGLVVSKIEMGSKASIAGLKPYELITHVADTPVRSVKDFEAALDAGGELRLSVKRMDKGRIVKIRMPAPQTRPAAAAPER